MYSIMTTIDGLDRKIMDLGNDISFNFDRLEKDIGNYSASRLVDRLSDIKSDLRSAKDLYRSLEREKEYVERKLSDIEDSISDLSRSAVVY